MLYTVQTDQGDFEYEGDFKDVMGHLVENIAEWEAENDGYETNITAIYAFPENGGEKECKQGTLNILNKRLRLAVEGEIEAHEEYAQYRAETQPYSYM